MENDIDGDTFTLLNKETIKEIVHTVMLRLKFQNAFAELIPKINETTNMADG